VKEIVFATGKLSFFRSGLFSVFACFCFSVPVFQLIWRDMEQKTDLLLAIYCYNHHKEKVSIKRVRELRSQMLNEALADPPRSRCKRGRTRKKKPKSKLAKS
jgi:hypothetical protein